MPDGAQVRFPDDMPREQIRDMIASKFPEAVQQAPKLSDPYNGSFANDGTAGPTYARGGRKLPDPQNPDGTFGQVPEGMALNPQTGQMEDLRSPANPNIPQGGANALALGVGQGAGFGMLDEAVAGLSSLAGGDYDYNLGRMREAERRASSEHPVSYYGGMLGGGAAQGVGLGSAGFLPSVNMVQQGAKLPAVALASGVEGLALGGLHGFGAGEGLEGRLDGAKTGAKWGAAAGVVAPYAARGVENMARRAVSPFASSAERAAAVRTLQNEGITLTAGQKTGNNWLRYRESELGGAKAAQMIDDQGRAFTDAAMRRAGSQGLATAENMSANADRLSRGFKNVSSRNTLRADRQLADDIMGTLREYDRVLPSEQKQILGNLTADVIDRIQAGKNTMPGVDYQVARSRFSRLAQNARNRDPDLAEAFRGIRNSLDEAMSRSISPKDAAEWSFLRKQYGNMKVLEKAAVGGGEDAALGIISPARLRMAASSGNQGGYARGQGDFSKLAKAGQAVMSPLPNSGTAQRMAAQGVSAAILGGGGGAIGGPAGLALGLAGPAAIGKMLMSKPLQNYLSNQMVNGKMSDAGRALIQMVLAGQSGSAAGRLPAP